MCDFHANYQVADSTSIESSLSLCLPTFLIKPPLLLNAKSVNLASASNLKPSNLIPAKAVIIGTKHLCAKSRTRCVLGAAVDV